MTNMELSTNRIIGLYAPQNTGKTTIINWIIKKIPMTKPIFIFDTNFERLSKYPQNTSNIKFIKAKTPSMQDKPEFFNEVLLYIRAQYSDAYIVVEDIDKILDSVKSSDDSEIYKLASDSRHQRFGFIYATKEPNNIPPILRSNTNLFFIGAFDEPAHVKVLSERVPKNTILSLKQHEFIMLDRYDKTRQIVTMDNNELKIVVE